MILSKQSFRRCDLMSRMEFLLPAEFVLLVMMFFLPTFNLNAQQLCPSTINDPTWGQVIYTSFEPWPYDQWGTVGYKKREIGGRWEIKVDWNSLYNLNRYGLTDEEFKQLMYKAVIVSLAEDCEHVGVDQKQIVFFEETECKKEAYCYLHVIKDAHEYCHDEGWQGPDPDIGSYGDERYYRVAKDFTCGTQCCEYIYTVECIYTLGYGNIYSHIIGITKNPEPGSTCPPSNDTDCLNGEPEPCQSTCN